MGVAFGAAWTPCVGPVAGTVLVVLGVLLLTGAYARLLGPLARLLPGSS